MKKQYDEKGFIEFRDSIIKEISLNELSNLFSEERDEKVTSHKKIRVYKESLRDKIINKYLNELFSIKTISNIYKISEKEVNKILNDSGLK
jgi:hypothetical protein